MSQVYKEKIIQEINDIPVSMLPKFYKIVHLLKRELVISPKKSTGRNSLQGIWQGSEIDNRLFNEAKKSIFNYE